jgi:outer membrane lipoprotein-sorting protein
MLKGMLFALIAGFGVVSSALAADALSDADATKLVQTIDDRQYNAGDFKGVCYIKETEKGVEPRLLQATYFRRDKDDKILILISKPKQEAGKGYLKIDKNLWMYDPGSGKWERRTERERIGGTNTRRADLDESRLARDYSARWIGEETIGQFKAHKLELTAKEGVDVPSPKLRILVDKASGNSLKVEEFALSGKLLRTAYYPQWIKEFSKSKGGDVWIPKEIRVFDELEKGRSTTILIKETDFSTLSDSTFTKAWVESQSR